MKKLDKKTKSNEKQIPKKENENKKELIKSTDFIHSIIHEYLLRKDYLNTLDVLQNNTYLTVNQLLNTLEKDVLTYMNNGKKKEFFVLWNRMIPSYISFNDLSLQKLEFFLQIYFAAYPILPNIIGDAKNIRELHLKDLKIRMQDFKIFLETKEIELSKTTEYLAYYALPYIQNPREHPSYKQIFTNDWVSDLRDKVKQCIKNYVPNGSLPVIYDLYFSLMKDHNTSNFDKAELINNISRIQNKDASAFLKEEDVNEVVINNNNNNNNEDEINKLKEEIQRIKKKEETAKKTLIDSQKKWTSFALDILGLSFDVISDHKKLRAGIEVPQDKVDSIYNKLIKYEQFLKKNADELEKNTNISSSKEKSKKDVSKIEINNNSFNNDKSQFDYVRSENVALNTYEDNLVSTNLLDMVAIREEFSKFYTFSKDVNYTNTVNSLLREVRLRLIRRIFKPNKNITLNSIIYYDIFGLRSKTVKIIQTLLTNEKVVLETLKLINNITNEHKGRTYILSRPSIIEEIVNLMKRETTDSEVRQNCLGIIQKFTLRSDPQKQLIKYDVIKWLVEILMRESSTISEYTLEYGLALLMNLSLRVSGRDKCEEISDSLLKILFNNFDNESLQVKTCINGTLYSILKRSKIKLQAKQMGLPKLLEDHLINIEDQMCKQYQYILDELNNDTEIEENADEDFEDDNYGEEEDDGNDDDFYEEESISEEDVISHQQYIRQFIFKDESQNENEINKIKNFIESDNNMSQIINNRMSYSSIRRDELDRPLRRPTTPMTNLSNSSTSQMFTNNPERKSIISKSKSNIRSREIKNIPRDIKKDNNNYLHPHPEEDKEKEIITIDTKKAFMKRDKLLRTPPNNSLENSYNN